MNEILPRISHIKETIESSPLIVNDDAPSESSDSSYHKPWLLENNDSKALRKLHSAANELDNAVILNDSCASDTALASKEKIANTALENQKKKVGGGVGGGELLGELWRKYDVHGGADGDDEIVGLDKYMSTLLKKVKNMKDAEGTKGFVVVDQKEEAEKRANLKSGHRVKKDARNENEIKGPSEASADKIIDDFVHKYQKKLDSMFVNLQQMPMLFRNSENSLLSKAKLQLPEPPLIEKGGSSARNKTESANDCFWSSNFEPPCGRDSDSESEISNQGSPHCEGVIEKTPILEIVNFTPKNVMPKKKELEKMNYHSENSKKRSAIFTSRNPFLDKLTNSDKGKEFFRRLESDLKRRKIFKENAIKEAHRKKEEELKLFESKKKSNKKFNVQESINKMMQDAERRAIELDRKTKEKMEQESHQAKALANSKFFSRKSQNFLNNHAKNIVKEELEKNMEILEGKYTPGLVDALEARSPKKANKRSELSRFQTAPRNLKHFESDAQALSVSSKKKQATKMASCRTDPVERRNPASACPRVKAFEPKEVSHFSSSITISKGQEYEFFLKKYNSRFFESKLDDINSNLCEETNELRNLRTEDKESDEAPQGYEIQNMPRTNAVSICENGSMLSLHEMIDSARSREARGFKFI